PLLSPRPLAPWSACGAHPNSIRTFAPCRHHPAPMSGVGLHEIVVHLGPTLLSDGIRIDGARPSGRIARSAPSDQRPSPAYLPETRDDAPRLPQSPSGITPSSMPAKAWMWSGDATLDHGSSDPLLRR